MWNMIKLQRRPPHKPLLRRGAVADGVHLKKKAFLRWKRSVSRSRAFMQHYLGVGAVADGRSCRSIVVYGHEDVLSEFAARVVSWRRCPYTVVVVHCLCFCCWAMSWCLVPSCPLGRETKWTRESRFLGSPLRAWHTWGRRRCFSAPRPPRRCCPVTRHKCKFVL